VQRQCRRADGSGLSGLQSRDRLGDGRSRSSASFEARSAPRSYPTPIRRHARLRTRTEDSSLFFGLFEA
jgi:hypothetical protein